MDAIDAIHSANAAGTAVQIQMAVTNKIMDTTTALQQDMISQLFASVGIGRNLDVMG
ncbi:hypothetical protein [Aminiphilus circumscriptus]|jgi:hypothetical protein|uniref:hypothetical protein n=1 Tax=Aminiphilus circumscriptus TaxID=290732 RepID=UPI0004B3250C|nr:hypothetical protein [Aminiphilus circumscriptus]